MNIRMMIPKNRDSSVTAILYIVGPVFVRTCFRWANDSAHPQPHGEAPRLSGAAR